MFTCNSFPGTLKHLWCLILNFFIFVSIILFFLFCCWHTTRIKKSFWGAIFVMIINFVSAVSVWHLFFLIIPGGASVRPSIINVYFSKVQYLVRSVQIDTYASTLNCCIVLYKVNKWTELNLLLVVSQREKGRDLTQSYDKSPYTNRNVKRAKMTT